MSTDQNMAVARRNCEDVWTNSDLSVIVQIVAPAVLATGRARVGAAPEVLRQRATNLHARAPRRG